MDKRIMKRIMIGFPCSERAWILPYFLEHIYNIDYNKKLIDIYIILNNSFDGSYKLLSSFKQKYEHEYNSITIEKYNNFKYPKDDRTQITRDKTYHFLCELRNKLLAKCVELDCEYLFSVDTDILVKRSILNDLILPEPAVCASLIYNGYLYTPPNEKGSGYDPVINSYKFPNILAYTNDKTSYKHIVNFYVKNPNLCEDSKILEVDATGAVSLIPKEICKISNYSWHSQGEDMSWSKTIQDAGYKLYCKPNVYSQHIMSPTLLQKYLNGELRFPNGDIIKI